MEFQRENGTVAARYEDGKEKGVVCGGRKKKRRARKSILWPNTFGGTTPTEKGGRLGVRPYQIDWGEKENSYLPTGGELSVTESCKGPVARESQDGGVAKAGIEKTKEREGNDYLSWRDLYLIWEKEGVWRKRHALEEERKERQTRIAGEKEVQPKKVGN